MHPKTPSATVGHLPLMRDFGDSLRVVNLAARVEVGGWRSERQRERGLAAIQQRVQIEQEAR